MNNRELEQRERYWQRYFKKIARNFGKPPSKKVIEAYKKAPIDPPAEG